MLTVRLHFHFSMVVSVFEPGPRACVMAPMWCVLTGRFDAVTHKPSAWGKRLCLLRCVRFLIPFSSRRTSPASVRLYRRHPPNTFRNSLTNRRCGGSVFDVCVCQHVCIWCCTGELSECLIQQEKRSSVTSDTQAPTVYSPNTGLYYTHGSQ